MDCDALIAGGGLAGACAAFCLSREGQSVRLLEAADAADARSAGASGAAAGLANPFMARKARPTWRLDDALGALRWIVGEAGAEDTFEQTGVLRPARSEKQAGFFQTTADEYPAHAAWLPPKAAAERAPAVETPHGALWIEQGGAADVPALIGALLAAAQQHGANVETGARVTGWVKRAGGLTVEVERGGVVEHVETELVETEHVETRRLLLCVGQGFGALPALAPLGLRAVKGETLRLRRPPTLEGARLPGLSGNGYVVPQPDRVARTTGTLLAGSTYDHDFTDLQPTDEGRRYILEKVSRMLPPLAEAEVIEARAGARVSPPGSHLPAVGPLPPSSSDDRKECVWVFTALGSRGLLTAPLLARALPRFLDDPARIPDAVRAKAAS